MKIKLVFIPRYHANPNTGEEDVMPPTFPPLGIAVLTQVLKNEHHMQVSQDDLDIKVKRYNQKGKKKINLKLFFDQERTNSFFKRGEDEEMEREAEKLLKFSRFKGYDIVGFSLMPTDNPSTAGVAAALAKVLKERYEPIILIGGSIRENVEKALLSTGFIDYRVFGYPNDASSELILPRICEAYENGVDIKNLLGVHYVENGRHVCNPVQFSKSEKGRVTTPCFDGLPMELYKEKITRVIDGEIIEEKILVLPYFFMKSCPHKCAFCSCSLEDWFNMKDPKEVAEDLEFFSKKYKTKFFYFHNATINPVYDFTEHVTDEIIKKDLNILWTDCANFSPMDKKLLEKLKKAGAARLVFGFEGGSPAMLRYVNKPFTIDQAEAVLKIASKLKIWCELDLICGLPYETLSDIECTIRFIEKNKKYLQACSLNKFWVDGLFLKYPERYGIRLRDWVSTHLSWSTTAFDELYGMKWEEKIEQMNKHFNLLQATIDKYFFPAPHPHHLFFNVLHGLSGKKL